MDTGLKNRVVLITGASGGIGLATATAFADEGANLVLHGRRQMDSLRAWVQQVGLGDRSMCVEFDVGDPEATRAGFDAAGQRFGRIDVCVANAGVWPPEDLPLHQMSPERFTSTLTTNLLGATWTARSFLAQLASHGPREDGQGASLVFTGSTAARFGERHHADYSVSKAGMYGLVRTLKNEIVQIDPFGRVNLVEPGWTVTHMARPALKDDGVVQKVVQTLPMQQLARAKDIARTIVFLSSPRLARHVSGEVVTVAGGMEGRILWEKQDVSADSVRARVQSDEA